MKTIWKFRIPQFPSEVVHLPVGAQLLSLQTQGDDQPYLWALVDPCAPVKEVSFATYGTGWDLPDDPGTYIGTYQVDEYVWHVFMKEAEKADWEEEFWRSQE